MAAVIRLILIFTLISYILLLYNQSVTAKLIIYPLWNVTSHGNDSGPCSLRLDYTDKNVTVLTGNQFEICSVQVTVSVGYATLIRITSHSSAYDFIYAERQGEMHAYQNKYMAITGDDPCVSKLLHTQFRLFLQGNISIFISETLANSILSERSEGIDRADSESRVSQTKLCPISEFNHTTSCIKTSTYVCSFDFPIHCNATLRTESVEFKCPSDNFATSYKPLVIYPTNVTELDLTRHRIAQIHGQPFHRLKTLNTIRLDFNTLSNLQVEVFQNLFSLSFLSLSGNVLTSLNASFQGLERLSYLSLSSNNLNTLQGGCFQKLFNLERLYLRDNQLVSLNKNLFSDLNSLAFLTLHRNKLQTLPNELFKGLTNLEYLSLHGNELTILSSNLFHELTNLEILYLYDNKLEYLPKELFKGLIKLEKIHLHRNKLRDLPVELFQLLSNLKNLRLDGNNLTVLPVNLFEGLTNLENLYLFDNKLTDLPIGLFKGLTNLLELLVASNQITSIGDNIFSDTSKLTHLSFRDNNLATLPKGIFKGLINLGSLYLQENNLTVLSSGLFNGLTNLLDLILYTNQMTVIHDNLFNETGKLSILHLGDNRLTSLPNELFKGLPNLQTLFLYYNNLHILPSKMFDGLTNLLKFEVYSNQIISVDSYLFNDTGKLVHLSLADTSLTVFPMGLFKGLLHLKTLRLQKNKLEVLPTGLLKGLTNLNEVRLSECQLISLDTDLFYETRNLIHIGLSNNRLKSLPEQLFLGLGHLEQLYLYDNQFNSLQNTLFQNLTNLKALDLGYNQLVQLSSGLFAGLNNLQILDLNSNKLTHLTYEVFKGLKTLSTLFLEFNHLRSLEKNVFQDTVNLIYLELSGNQLQNIPNIIYLNRLTFINLRQNKLTKISKVTFNDLPIQTEIIVSQTEICECYVSNTSICTALDVRSPYLTCDRLLSDKALVVMMWLIGINAIGGNLFVLCWSKRKADKNKPGSRNPDKSNVQSFLLNNLALSDLLMGIYMLLIASADIYFGDNFPMQAEAWRSGITCRIAGTLSILSSEASVFFITLISIDRLINIRCPFSQRKLGKTSSMVIVALLWIISLTLGVVPSSLAGRNYKFYDNSHVCIGLPLNLIEMFKKSVSEDRVDVGGTEFYYIKYTVESQSQGKVRGIYFATATFLGLNCVCYLIILFCYIEIIRVAFKSSKRAGINKEVKQQIRMTAKVAAIVLTDFVCWFPIILLGMLVQAKVLTLPPSVFAWCVTFVLPINSAINPYLYTIAQLISNYRKATKSADSGKANIDVPKK